MSAEARARLATKQAELVAALAGRAAAPAEFDAVRLQAAAASLATKRRHAVARAWPSLTEALGDDFEERFRCFAAATPLPRFGGPVADGRAFLCWLGPAADFGDACRLQELRVDLRFRKTSGGLAPRRGPALEFAVLREARRLVIALRLLWLGERWLSLPLGRAPRDRKSSQDV